MALDVRERVKPVVFDFEQPVGMIESLGDANQRHRADVHQVQPLTLSAAGPRGQPLSTRGGFESQAIDNQASSGAYIRTAEDESCCEGLG